MKHTCTHTHTKSGRKRKKSAAIDRRMRKKPIYSINGWIFSKNNKKTIYRLIEENSCWVYVCAHWNQRRDLKCKFWIWCGSREREMEWVIGKRSESECKTKCWPMIYSLRVMCECHHITTSKDISAHTNTRTLTHKKNFSVRNDRDESQCCQSNRISRIENQPTTKNRLKN